MTEIGCSKSRVDKIPEEREQELRGQQIKRNVNIGIQITKSDVKSSSGDSNSEPGLKS